MNSTTPAPKGQDIEKFRAGFEAWATGPDGPWTPRAFKSRIGAGYGNPDLQIQWDCWTAAKLETSTEPSSTIQGAASGDALDAARWRALLGSARIRIIGSAGINQDTNPYGEPHNGYAHFGMEIWTKYGTSLSALQKEEMEVGNANGRSVITKYADIAISAIATSTTKD